MSERSPAPDAAQRERIDLEVDRDLLVAAGAGSGKTSKLVDRYLALLRGGVPPREIVVVTFTRKAAAEMKHRIRGRLLALASAQGEQWRELAWQVEEAPIETIDAFCLRLLRAEALAAGLDPGFEILDDELQEALPKEVARQFLRARLADDDDAALDLLDIHGGLAPMIDILTGMLSHRKLWLDPFRPEPDDPLAARAIAFLRGEAYELPSHRELRDRLDAATEELRQDLLEQWCRSDLFAELHELYRSGSAAGVPEDDKFLPTWRAGLAVVLAVREGDAEALRQALIALRQVKLTGGVARSWGDLLGRAKVVIGRVRDWAKNWRAAFLDDDEELAETAVAATLAALKLLPGLAEALDAEKQRLGRLAFDDLVLGAARLLAGPEGEAITERVRRRYSHVLLDEYQDTDSLQDTLLRHLAGGRPGAFFAVGDDKQSIYRFRGAEVEVFNRARRAAGQGLVELTATFRLTPPLADTLNGMFGAEALMGTEEHDDPGAARFVPLRAVHDPDRVTLPGDPVRLLLGQHDGPPEAEVIAEHLVGEVGRSPTISEWRGGTDCRTLGFGDIAVLVRRNRDIEPVREALMARGVPVRTEQGRLTRRQEVLDLLALARWLLDPTAPLALVTLLRSPLVGLADDELYRIAGRDGLVAGMRRLLDGAAVDGVDAGEALARLRRWRDDYAGRPLPEVLRRAADEADYLAVLAALPQAERRLANVEKLLDDLWARRQAGLSDEEAVSFYERRRDQDVSQDTEGPVYDVDADAVNLLTIHKAKGLEWPVVYLAGLAARPPAGPASSRTATWLGLPVAAGVSDDKARLPLVWQSAAAPRGPRLEFEDERLLYVACTRARDRLVLSARLDKTGGWSSESWFAALAEGLKLREGTVGLPGVAIDPLPELTATADPLAERRAAIEALLAAEPPVPPAVTSPVPPVLASVPATRTDWPAAAVPGPDYRQADLPAEVTARMTATQRGSIVHNLLRVAAYAGRLPDSATVRAAAAERRVTLDPAHDEALITHLLETARRGFDQAEVRHALTAARVLIETPFLWRHDGYLISGRIDLAGIFADEVHLLDYKTGGLTPELARSYGSELACYAAALAERYPRRRLSAWLVMVDLGEAIPLRLAGS